MRQNAQALEEILKNFDIWVQAPFEEAVQIPSALYTSGAVTEFEIERIFRREWICIGQVDEIAAVGDYFVTAVSARETDPPRPALGCPRKRVNSSPSISTCFGLRPTPSSPAFSALVESTFPLTCSRRDRVSGSS